MNKNRASIIPQLKQEKVLRYKKVIELKQQRKFFNSERI